MSYERLEARIERLEGILLQNQKNIDSMIRILSNMAATDAMQNEIINDQTEMIRELREALFEPIK